MTKRGIIMLFSAVAIVAGAGGWLSAEALAAKIKRDLLKDRLGEIQLAVERYAVDNKAVYPASLDEVLAAGTFEKMPENPYTHEPMQVLAPADAPVPGGVVYVAWGPQVAEPDGTVHQEYDEYRLVAYADKPQPDGYAGGQEVDWGPPGAELLDSINWVFVAVELRSH